MLTLLLSFLPVQKNILAQAGRKHADTAPGFDLAAVVADVLNPGIYVRRNPMRAGRIRPIVEPGRGDGHGEAVQAISILVQVVAENDDILTLRLRNRDRINRLRQGFLPAPVHFSSAVAPHTKIVDPRLSGKRA